MLLFINALLFMYRAFSSLISSNSSLWNTSRTNFRGGAICWDGSRVFPRCCAFQVTWFTSGALHPELSQRYIIMQKIITYVIIIWQFISFQKYRKLIKIEDDVAALRKKLNPVKAASIDTELEL